MYKRVESKFEELMAVWNPDTECDEVKKLPLFKGIVGKEEVCGYSLVDTDTYDKWSVIMWVLMPPQGYVKATFSTRNKERLGSTDQYAGMGSKDYLLLHRVVLGTKDDRLCVDHIDHDILNNCSRNLREVSVQENCFNRQKGQGTSNYKGVCYIKVNTKRPWRVQIGLKGFKQYVKSFKTEIEAVQEYDKKALELFGEHAYLNFPDVKTK